MLDFTICIWVAVLALQSMLELTVANEVNLRVTGGSRVEEGRFPYVAFLKIFDETKRSFDYCGASLISPSVLLSAAHCVKSNHAQISATVGCQDLQDSRCKWLKIDALTGLPGTDLLLLKLPEPSKATPVSLLRAGTQIPNGVVLKIAGFGAENVGGGMSHVLRQAEVRNFDRDLCDEQYRRIEAIRNELSFIPTSSVLMKSQICAVGSNHEDACQGDSGSPLVLACPSHDILTAFVSTGIGCGYASIPGIYTDISFVAINGYIENYVESLNETVSFASEEDLCLGESFEELRSDDFELFDINGWNCAGKEFAGLDGCNCGCGIPDPDCQAFDEDDCGLFETCSEEGKCTISTSRNILLSVAIVAFMLTASFVFLRGLSSKKI